MTALLEINQLKTILHTGKAPVCAVDQLSLNIAQGETFALLGESGCGKSMTALSMMRLLPEAGEIVSGSIKIKGNDLLKLSEASMRSVRGKQISMIFQEPMLSLNPILTIADQIGEVLKRHFNLRGDAAQKRILELLDQVGIPDAARRMYEYPFQFSGGMKQRVMIAIALAGEPELLIADEPTTALDVTIQAQVLELMREIQQNTQMAILLITHDLGVVSEMAHKVAVMYAGEIIETASRDDFFRKPAHPYSQQLFASLPEIKKRGQALNVMRGSVPQLSQIFTGCRFADRCHHAWEHCHQAIPQWQQVEASHQVRCHLFNQQYSDKKNTINKVVTEETKTTASSVEHKELLRVNQLQVHFPIHKGLFKRVVGYVKAVDGVSLSIQSGKTLALVGESGCGKTTVGKGILQLIKPTGGQVYFNGTDLVGLARKQLRAKRSECQIIFQDPYASLNPRMRIIEVIQEGMDALNTTPLDSQHTGGKSQSFPREQEVDALLKRVGLPTDVKWRYPHEFSGGQRQRIAIARALAVNPQLLICDEPTSALDVSVQAQILNLLKSIQNNLGLSYLFITHDISVVAYLADEVAVMYLGRIVEQGQMDEILNHPKHPYTQALLSAVPRMDKTQGSDIIRLEGDLPSPSTPPLGCHFHPRCPHVRPECRTEYPQLHTISDTHTVQCHIFAQ